MTTKSMQIVHTIQEMKELLDRSAREQQTVGFVPTMGFLHEGHLQLVKNARQLSDLVVMSIFVNPAQFGPNEDFDAYPRNEERDIQLAKENGVDLLFIPSVEEMYPRPIDIHITPGPQSTVLCGASRPGHFDGVLKVILKLFNIVDPDYAFFGLKDAQQLAIIETFVKDFNFRTKIVRVPTVREADGLAKSSRNVNLSSTERQEATMIYKALQQGAEQLRQQTSSIEVEQWVSDYLTSHSSGQVDYVKVYAYPSLEPVDASTKEMILACAVQFEKARLIDNIIILVEE